MAIRALVIDLELLLRKEGATLVSDIRKQLPIAEGSLRDSLEHTVTQEGSIVRLQLTAAPHFRFVELGRKKGGKMPPLAAIRRWCEVKGIPVRAAFPIAKSIQTKGIAPRHILKNVLPRAEASIQAKISRAFGEAMRIEGTNLIKRVFPEVKTK